MAIPQTTCRILFHGLAAVTAVLFSSTDVAHAAGESVVNCDAEAAVIVAQLKSEHERPISDEALSLARQAALRGCLTKTQPRSDSAAASESDDEVGGGFWDRLRGTDAKRGEGHDRLRRRGQY